MQQGGYIKSLTLLIPSSGGINGMKEVVGEQWGYVGQRKGCKTSYRRHQPPPSPLVPVAMASLCLELQHSSCEHVTHQRPHTLRENGLLSDTRRLVRGRQANSVSVWRQARSRIHEQCLAHCGLHLLESRDLGRAAKGAWRVKKRSSALACKANMVPACTKGAQAGRRGEFMLSVGLRHLLLGTRNQKGQREPVSVQRKAVITRETPDLRALGFIKGGRVIWWWVGEMWSYKLLQSSK